MHFANYTYAHSVCFYLPEVDENDRIVLQKCMPLQLKGRIFSKNRISLHAKDTIFPGKWLSLHAKSSTFSTKWPSLHTKGSTFSTKWPPLHTKGITFLPKCPIGSAKNITFSTEWPSLHLLKALLTLGCSLFCAVYGFLFGKNSSGTINQYFIKPPGIIPKWNNPRDLKSKAYAF